MTRIALPTGIGYSTKKIMKSDPALTTVQKKPLGSMPSTESGTLSLKSRCWLAYSNGSTHRGRTGGPCGPEKMLFRSISPQAPSNDIQALGSSGSVGGSFGR